MIFVGGIGAGVAISTLPSISKAQRSANKVFDIINSPSKVDPQQLGVKQIKEGEIDFFDVLNEIDEIFKALKKTQK